MKQHFYQSLNYGSTTQTTMVKDAFSIKSNSEISSIKNFAPTELYENFDDSASQVSRHSSNTPTMLETKSATSSIVSNLKKLSIQSAASASNLNDESYDDFDNSVSMALPSPTTTANSTSSSHISRNKDLDKLNDYECYLRTCNIDWAKKIRPPLESTMNWINSRRQSTPTYLMPDSNKSIASSIVNLNDSSQSQESAPTPSTTSTTNTASRRSMLAKLATKESVSVSTNSNVLHNSKNYITHYGVPAGYATNCLKTFGGLSNKNKVEN